MNDTIKKPEALVNFHLIYLDELRDSGATNMFGAGAYLQDEFDLSRNEAREILLYWMNTYEERHA